MRAPCTLRRRRWSVQRYARFVADATIDEVLTNSIPPVDAVTFLGPGVQSSEIERILKSGGVWFRNGQVEYVKP